MTDSPTRRRTLGASILSAAVVATLLATTVLTGSVEPAAAAGRVSVESETGGATADPDYATTVTVTGAGFQSIAGGFGGVYVLFGWVADGTSWQPSEGGTVGTDYRYVPDSEAKDNQGFQRFVAFPGSETEDSANAVMAADGSWSVDMIVPGASFESLDRSGEVSSVDCLSVTCGIITIGAHGVKNANNETFTPIDFRSTTGAGEETPPASGADSGGPPSDTAATAARVGYTTTTAVPGQALSFTGQGFDPGELIVATLDDGVSAVGPLTAGASGEIAGVLPLPADLRVGTHLLTLTGAASGRIAESNVTVSADPAVIPSATDPTALPTWPYIVLGVAVLVALVLLILSIATSIRRSVRARAARRTEVTA
ncbi:hypothetical protein [Labedella endophytica]|uniref:hypothetical protein n=1 Tax=Labedella endophytica TaxID=1523160 RepID=UPI001AA0137C|nr:hypothetical protein [Labedella endophytica]